MKSSLNLKSINKDIFKLSGVIFYGLCASLLLLFLSLGTNYHIFIKYFLSLGFGIYISIKALSPYFKQKRISLVLSLPLLRKDYYKEYVKPYLILISILLISTFLFTIVVPKSFFDLIESCGLLLIFISLGFIISIKTSNLSFYSDIFYFIVFILSIIILFMLVMFIKFIALGSLYILLLSLLFVAYSLITTKKKFLNNSY